jgi:hypothetical protein
MVHLHAGQHNGGSGGVGGEWKVEQYCVDLLAECPEVPTAEAVLRIVARDPVAQARFFILAMRLFCGHVDELA